MKIFILILCMFSFSALAQRGNWVAKSKLKLPHDSYRLQSKCESVESDACFNKDLCENFDERRCRVGFRAINVDRTKDCLDAVDCDEKLNETFSCGESGEAPAFDDKANWPGLDFSQTTPPRNATGWFLWCEKETLLVDVAGNAAADSDDANAVAEKSARAGAKTIREVSLQQCIQDSKNPTLTPTQTKDCIKAIVRELLGGKVSLVDL